MKEIPFNDFLTKYQAGEINVVDVREQEEYDALHLDGVTLLPLISVGRTLFRAEQRPSLLCHLQVWQTISPRLPIFGKRGL